MTSELERFFDKLDEGQDVMLLNIRRRELRKFEEEVHHDN